MATRRDQRIRRRPSAVLFISGLLGAIAPPALAGDLSHESIRAATETGKRAILNEIREFDEIEYRRGNRIVLVRGRVTGRVKEAVVLKTDQGERLTIPENAIRKWKKAGMVNEEMGAPCASGPSTLAAFALVTAGVETTHAKLASLLRALDEQEGPGMGTYVHSLRASLWSALLERPIGAAAKTRYRNLLQRDVNWLTSAAMSDGSYGYNAEPAGYGDHSNTQFADLGLWSASIARVEISNTHWRRMAQHWMRTQNPDGGWGYIPGTGGGSTASMTVAGCNSLYIAIDRFYSRMDQPYALFEGCRPNKQARSQIEEVYAAIQRGDEFLRKNPPNVAAFHGYELFGLERLGLASGQVYLGGQDWFRTYARRTAARAWGDHVVADSFALIFLVHGLAPVLIQKLEHGSRLEDWNYYPRDVAALARYLSRTFERLVRWQRIPETASVRQMLDAPFLFISGSKELRLKDQTLRAIREYIDHGGTVFLHADRAGRRFVAEAGAMFEALFKDRNLRFSRIDDSHPVYTCHFGGPSAPWKRRLPLLTLEDESRVLVYLCPVDIAGAWQQEKKAFDELFRIMANIRVYSAPPYTDLPSVLRPSKEPAVAALPRGRLRLLRLAPSGSSTAHPDAWARYAADLLRRTGLELILLPDTSLRTPAPDPPDMVHLSLSKDVNLDAVWTDPLLAYLRGGGLLLVDAADGRPTGIAAVQRFAEELDVGERAVLSADHAIATGTLPGGSPLIDLETTEAGIGLSRGKAPPPIITRSIDGRIVLIACPFDLVAALDRVFVWNRSGYRRESTQRIVDNILLWRFHQGGGAKVPANRPGL